MQKLRKDDEVIVITGKDKGKIGKILQVINPDKIIVAGVAIAKKHVKPNPNKNETGGVVDTLMPIHISNVAIYNNQSKKSDRVGIKVDEQGKKARIFKSDGTAI